MSSARVGSSHDRGAEHGPAVDGHRRDRCRRDGEGFGLHSVRERLKGHFGDRADFTLTRDEKTDMTVARIDMPHVRVAA